MAIGHPDNQDYVNWRGPILFSGALNITTVSSVNIPTYVTNFASMLLRIAQTSGIGMTVTVTYYNDATLGVPAGQYRWILNNATELKVLVPNLGNYAQVAIFTSQAGTQGGIGYIELNNLIVPAPRYPVTGNVSSGASVAIANGASFTAVMPFLIEGDGSAFCQCSSATGPFTMEVDAFDESQTLIGQAFRFNGVTGPQLFSFKTSINPVSFKITNGDTVSRNFTFQCAIRGD